MIEALVALQLFLFGASSFAAASEDVELAQATCTTDMECNIAYEELMSIQPASALPEAEVRCKSGYRGVPDCETIR